MATLWTLDAANLFAGDHDPTNSKHLTLENIKLPALQEIYAEHHGGGARVQIEIPVGVQKLEPTFRLVGFDPALLVQFGLSSRISHIYTMYGEIRDRRTGRAIELKAIMEGRLGKIEGDAYKRGELLIQEYAISGLTHYEVHFDGRELLLWDYFTNAWRVDGVDQNADSNRILRVPNSGV